MDAIDKVKEKKSQEKNVRRVKLNYKILIWIMRNNDMIGFVYVEPLAKALWCLNQNPSFRIFIHIFIDIMCLRKMSLKNSRGSNHCRIKIILKLCARSDIYSAVSCLFSVVFAVEARVIHDFIRLRVFGFAALNRKKYSKCEFRFCLF